MVSTNVMWVHECVISARVGVKLMRFAILCKLSVEPAHVTLMMGSYPASPKWPWIGQLMSRQSDRKELGRRPMALKILPP